MNETILVPTTLADGTSLMIEATRLDRDGFESTKFEAKSFESVIAAISGIGLAVRAGLERVRPTKASVELGLEIGLESGQLTALLVKGSGKANIKITLQWESSDAAAEGED